MSKATKKQIEQLAKLLADSHAVIQKDDAPSRERFDKSIRRIKGRPRKLRERDLIPISPKHRGPDYQPRNRKQVSDEGKNDMYAERTMIYPSGQTRLWGRILLAAAVLAIALFGVILARNVYRGDSLSVSYIQEEANREAFTLYIDEVWNQGNVDVLGDVAAEGIIYHDTTLAEDVVGVQGVSALITNYRAAMLDFTYSIDSMTADEDRVWAQITASGTHTSALELPDGVSIPASMNTATWSVTVVSQFEDGKIVETWIQADSLGFMQQIGIMPTLQEQTTEAQNIEHVRTFYETIEAREYEDPAYEELFAPTFIWHDPNSSEVYTVRPRDSVNSLRGTERAFPDFRNTIHHISAVGDAVMVHWTFTGTFEEAWNPGRGVCQPTHEEVAYEGIDIFRLEEGVIAEWWTYWDNPFVIDPEENCGER